MLGVIVGVVLMLVGIGTFIAQIVTGSAMLGLDHFVDREENPRQFWFIIGIETLMLIVAVAATLAYHFGPAE